MECGQGFRGVWGGGKEGTQLNPALEIREPEFVGNQMRVSSHLKSPSDFS